MYDMPVALIQDQTPEVGGRWPKPTVLFWFYVFNFVL
jgi:hypothetical protein